MKKITIKPTNRLKRNESYEGRSIEYQLREMKNGTIIEFQNKPEYYTARKDGVVPETDVRTDKFEMMLGATDKLSRARIAKTNEFDKQGETNNGEKSTKSGEKSAKSGEKTPGESIHTQITE